MTSFLSPPRSCSLESCREPRVAHEVRNEIVDELIVKAQVALLIEQYDDDWSSLGASHRGADCCGLMEASY